MEPVEKSLAAVQNVGVDSSARSMKARIQVIPREGGGATFRITFKTLPAEARRA